MENIQILAVIRPALQSELFGDKDTPFKNALFFTKKTRESIFYGPYIVLDHVNLERFIDLYIFRELYVITTEESGFSFLMNLRQADKDDMLDGIYLRVNYSYYIKENEGDMEGPYVLTNETDPYYIAGLINTKSIYVVAEKQSFCPFSLEKSA
jgi:hypothetical protein